MLAAKSTELVACVLESNLPTGFARRELVLQQRFHPQLRSLFKMFKTCKGNHKEFILFRNVLYKRNLSDGRKYLFVVPPGLRDEVLNCCHDYPISSLLGVEKSIDRVISLYWCP